MSGPDPAIDGLPRFVIDRNSPVPLYFQVAQHLENAIHTGALPTGTLFQNEVDLAASLGLSRPTMRRAMQHLVDKGLVVRRRGIGTRVVQPKLRRPLELTSLYDDLTRAGRKPTTETLSFQTVEAADDVAERLEVPEGTSVLELVRLRRADGEPIAKLTNYLPERIATFAEDDLAEHGLYELIRQPGRHPALRDPDARRPDRDRRRGQAARRAPRRSARHRPAGDLRRPRHRRGVRQPHLRREPLHLRDQPADLNQRLDRRARGRGLRDACADRAVGNVAGG